MNELRPISPKTPHSVRPAGGENGGGSTQPPVYPVRRQKKALPNSVEPKSLTDFIFQQDNFQRFGKIVQKYPRLGKFILRKAFPSCMIKEQQDTKAAMATITRLVHHHGQHPPRTMVHE